MARYGHRRKRMESLQDYLLFGVGGLLASALFAWFGRMILIERLGRHVSTQRFGKFVDSTYLLDETARRRVRWGTLVIFMLLLACFGACILSTLGQAGMP
jgi:hypothetical protein